MKTVPLDPVNDHGISCHQYEPLLTLMTCRGMLKGTQSSYFQYRGDAIMESMKMMYDTDKHPAVHDKTIVV